MVSGFEEVCEGVDDGLAAGIDSHTGAQDECGDDAVFKDAPDCARIYGLKAGVDDRGKFAKTRVSKLSHISRSRSIDSILRCSSDLAESCNIKLKKVNPSASHINFTYIPQRRFKKGLTSPIFNKAVHKLYSLLGSCGRSMEANLDDFGGDKEDDGGKMATTDNVAVCSVSSNEML